MKSKVLKFLLSECLQKKPLQMWSSPPLQPHPIAPNMLFGEMFVGHFDFYTDLVKMVNSSFQQGG